MRRSTNTRRNSTTRIARRNWPRSSRNSRTSKPTRTSPTPRTWNERATQQLAKLEGENAHYGTWLYRYQLLKAKVIRHLPEDRFETIVWIMVAVVIGVFLKGIFEFFHEVARRQRHQPHAVRPAQRLLPPRRPPGRAATRRHRHHRI